MSRYVSHQIRRIPICLYWYIQNKNFISFLPFSPNALSILHLFQSQNILLPTLFKQMADICKIIIRWVCINCPIFLYLLFIFFFMMKLFLSYRLVAALLLNYCYLKPPIQYCRWILLNKVDWKQKLVHMFFKLAFYITNHSFMNFQLKNFFILMRINTFWAGISQIRDSEFIKQISIFWCH